MSQVVDLAGEERRAFEDSNRHIVELKMILLRALCDWMAA